MESLIIFLPLLAIMYFVLIRPQQRQMKEKAALLASLETGEDVILSSGIYGTVTEIDDGVVWLEVAQDLELKVAKSAVETVLRTDDEDIETADAEG